VNQQSSLWSDAWRRLLANKAAVAGGLILLFLMILAIFAPWIAPHSYSYQNLELGAQPPSSEFLLGTDTLGRDLFSRILVWCQGLFVGWFCCNGCCIR
jgi:ABC-type dipeptide/oligopeptide/nickel transport system permease subunit